MKEVGGGVGVRPWSRQCHDYCAPQIPKRKESWSGYQTEDLVLQRWATKAHALEVRTIQQPSLMHLVSRPIIYRVRRSLVTKQRCQCGCLSLASSLPWKWKTRQRFKAKITVTGLGADAQYFTLSRFQWNNIIHADWRKRSQAAIPFTSKLRTRVSSSSPS